MRRSDREEPTSLRDLPDLLTKAVADGGRADVNDDDETMMMFRKFLCAGVGLSEQIDEQSQRSRAQGWIYVGPRSQNRDLVLATSAPLLAESSECVGAEDTDNVMKKSLPYCTSVQGRHTSTKRSKYRRIVGLIGL